VVIDDSGDEGKAEDTRMGPAVAGRLTERPIRGSSPSPPLWAESGCITVHLRMPLTPDGHCPKGRLIGVRTKSRYGAGPRCRPRLAGF